YPDKRPRAPDHNLLKQVKESEHSVSGSRVAPRSKEIPVKVADPARCEVAPVPPGDQGNLVVEIEKIIVDWRGRKQNDLLSRSVTTFSTIRPKELFHLTVALGVLITEVMRLVDQHKVSIARGVRLNLLPPQLFLR